MVQCAVELGGVAGMTTDVGFSNAEDGGRMSVESGEYCEFFRKGAKLPIDILEDDAEGVIGGWEKIVTVKNRGGRDR